MEKIKLYKDSKELPFLNYKRIMEGDFFYMVKGYESGDEIDADPKELEEKFNELINDFVIAMNQSSEELTEHCNYMVSTIEFNKISLAIQIIDFLILLNNALSVLNINESDEDNLMVAEVLEGIKVSRNPDLEIQKKLLSDKLSYHESNIAKYEELINNQKKDDGQEENDLDKQFINVCLGLEIPFPDEQKLSLYQFSIMIERVIEKMKALEKLNKK